MKNVRRVATINKKRQGTDHSINPFNFVNLSFRIFHLLVSLKRGNLKLMIL